MSLESELEGQNRDAFKAVENLFRGYGLESLSPKIKEYIEQGYSAETISILLSESNEYKQRFAGNETRKQKGLPVLSPRDYIAMEDQYKGLFRSYGLPQNMFDNNEDFVSYIGGGVSVNEMGDRLNIARSAVMADDPYTRDTYRAWYAAGLNEGDAIAAVLSPDRALPELERKARSAALGAASIRQGVGINQSRAEQLANLGVDGNTAVQAFGQIADVQRRAGGLASRYGMEYGGQSDAEDAVFFGDSNATERIRKLGRREEAEFGARGAGDSRSLGGRSY